MRMRLLMALLAALAGPGRAAEPVVAYTIINGAEITDSLTGAPGDADRGRALYRGEARAGCPACHGVPGVATEFAATAPDLSNVGERLGAGAIRLWIVAPTVFSDETAMPSFYAAGQRTGADDPLYGGPALTAGEIEDLVAYLAALGAPG
ncbi:MAG TPA: c-type cytochrome [Thermohalobaculum sp.]|nr:c-type cytochrome [Thermohalobaculum sp.]